VYGIVGDTGTGLRMPSIRSEIDCGHVSKRGGRRFAAAAERPSRASRARCRNLRSRSITSSMDYEANRNRAAGILIGRPDRTQDLASNRARRPITATFQGL